MKQQIDPKVLVAVVVAGVLLLAFIGYRTWSAPSVTPAPEVANAASTSRTGAPGMPGDAGAIRGSGNRGGGGPTAADLQKRDAYNAANPGAAGSGR